MHCLVAGPRPVKSTCNTDDDAPLAALLLDRRLIKTKGMCITSFFSGSVLAFLPDASLFPDSTVLDAVPPDTLDAFTPLVVAAVGSGRRFKLLFRSSRDGATAAAFHSRPCFGYGGCSVEFGSLCGTYVPQNTYKNLTEEAGYNTMTGRQFFTPAIVEVFKI
jgi:hypothetical protein